MIYITGTQLGTIIFTFAAILFYSLTGISYYLFRKYRESHDIIFYGVIFCIASFFLFLDINLNYHLVGIKP